MNKTFYLIRHGETIWNKNKIFRGRNEIPLNENGINAAHKTGQILKNKPIEIIFTSPLTRSVQTAEIVASYLNGVKVIKDEGFQNIDIGEWEGKKEEEVKKLYPREYKMWLTEPENLTIPGGESIIDVQNRAFKRLNELLKSDYDNIAIVSHRSVLKVLLAAALEMKGKNYFWKIRVDTAHYNILEYDSSIGFILTKLNG